jgi:hypothetical protein
MKPVPEPWGRRLWLTLAAVVVVAAWLQSYGISTWPMADDEVPSLVELGLFHESAGTFSVPANQVGRLPETLPVWYGSQRFLLNLLPKNQMGYRLPSVVYGVLTAGIAFLLAARWRGLWFALALSIVLNGSQLFVYLAQLDRFYSLSLLLLTLVLAAIWLPVRSRSAEAAMVVAIGVLAALAMLSHNLTFVVFLLAFLAAAAGNVLGGVPRRVLWRSGAAAFVCLLVYVFYVRPLVAGWSSTGNPTPILISYAAEAGVPALALALLGAWFVLERRRDEGPMVWWLLMFAGSFCVYLLAWFNWNPRYFELFLPATWVLAAYAMESVARGLGGRFRGAAWYGVVVVLLLPGLVSHFQDGSRHDYRRAAEVLVAEDVGGQPILSDDAETISYYLPADLRAQLFVRTKVTELPSSVFYLVVRSNAWMPQPRIPGRRMDLLAEISRRRFDEFSHVLRVYRVSQRQD